MNRRGPGFQSPSRSREGSGEGTTTAARQALPRPLPQAGGENGRIASFARRGLLKLFAGGSVGKLLFGLRTVDKNTGAVAGFGKSFVRWILWVVDGFPYCLPLVGLITGLSTKGHRRVGDMAAGTLVVGKASVGTPPAYPGGPVGAPPVGGWSPPPPPGGFAPPRSWPTW